MNAGAAAAGPAAAVPVATATTVDANPTIRVLHDKIPPPHSSSEALIPS